MTQRDPGSWAANRASVGWAILGTTWSSAWLGIASVQDSEDTAAILLLLAGISGLIALCSLTSIGFRLAFSDEPGSRASRPISKRGELVILGGVGVLVVGAVALVGLAATR